MLYRVRSGCTFGHSDQHGPGTLLDLSEHEALPFLDKLEPLTNEGGGDASLDTESSDPDAEAERPKGRQGRRKSGEQEA